MVFARNDGNLTRMEVLLGMGEMQGVLTVLVNDVEIPLGVCGHQHDGDGLVQHSDTGNARRAHSTRISWTAAATGGRPVRQHGVPFGGGAEPDQQRHVAAYGQGAGAGAEGAGLLRRTGRATGEQFSSNPAWVLLDMLRTGGWALAEIDVASFARGGGILRRADRGDWI